jgi:hypothetical protein
LPAQAGYQKPPKSITDILDAPAAAGLAQPDARPVAADPARPYPPIADLARPMLRLAGYRIDPVTNVPTPRRASSAFPA